jgi:rubrerythrin
MRVAVADEQSGEQMHKKMAARTENPKLKSQFSDLAGQENAHQQAFHKMQIELEKTQSTEHLPDMYADYLELLIADGYPAKAHEELEACETDADMVNLAIRFERDQLALQRDLSDLLGVRDHEMVNQIIQEEREHLVQLSLMRKSLSE